MLITATTRTAARAAPGHPALDVDATNASTCTRSRHLVLASFGEPDSHHTVSLYFASKFPDTAVHHLLLHLGHDKTEERIKGSIHRKNTATDWRTFYRSHDIHSSVIDMSLLEDYRKFRENYVHSSINGYEYELLTDSQKMQCVGPEMELFHAIFKGLPKVLLHFWTLLRRAS